MGKDETPIQFSTRVKEMICKKIGLKSVEWDGMMKYYAPSEKLKQARQKLFADRLKNKVKKKYCKIINIKRLLLKKKLKIYYNHL